MSEKLFLNVFTSKFNFNRLAIFSAAMLIGFDLFSLKEETQTDSFPLPHSIMLDAPEKDAAQLTFKTDAAATHMRGGEIGESESLRIEN
jgi:hypothetical protein